MALFRDRLKFSTTGARDMTDVTAEVEAVVRRSGIKSGICHVFNIGSTGAIGTIEFESGLTEDFPDLLHKIAPQGRSYGHERKWRDGNGHSHLQASLLGASITVPVEDGMLILGRWQQIFHYEADIKPRSREIVVTVMGE